MLLLAEDLVSLSDGVCASLRNGPSLFWSEKSKPFMLWSGNNYSVCVIPVRIHLFVVVKKNPYCVMKASAVVRFKCEIHTP